MAFDTSGISQLEKELGYKFKDINLLITALTHSSARKENSGVDYERLEFLGDAVLDLGIADILLAKHPSHKEGELSKMRAALVNTASLANVARDLNVGNLIQLSPGEASSGGADKDSILADVTEAIFGAIYSESGFDSTIPIIKDIFGEKAVRVIPKDPKTELQEVLHTLNMPIPEYKLESSEGPDHAPVFVTVVKIGEEVKGIGKGTSKKSSQQSAALEALKTLKGTS